MAVVTLVLPSLLSYFSFPLAGKAKRRAHDDPEVSSEDEDTPHEKEDTPREKKEKPPNCQHNNTSTGSSDDGVGVGKGSSASDDKHSLFRHSPVVDEDLQILIEYIKSGDGGALAVAWQAVTAFQSLSDHVGNVTTEHTSSIREIRQLAASANRPAPSGAAVHIADAVFSLVPHKIVLRAMRYPKMNIPLPSLSQSNANVFGNRDVLMPKAKRQIEVPWTGTPLQLLEDLTKLISLVVIVDAQYGSALLGAQLVAIDLLKRRVSAEVVAKYIEGLRNSALDRLSGDTLKRFFTLDVALFARAGGLINSSGEAVGDKSPNVPAVVPNPKIHAAGQKADRKASRQNPKYVEWPFKDSTCKDFNSKWRGCHQLSTSGYGKCKFAHSCAVCNQKHPVHEHDQKHIAPLTIEQ